jgi:hypothetical protein
MTSAMRVSLHQILTIYAWFGLGSLLFLMALIARFYERLSGERTYYQWFVVPVIAFAGATIREAQLDQVTGDITTDLLLLIGGVSLAVLCVHIYHRMTRGR